MKVVISRFATAKSYVTRDGSRIRELMHPDVHGNKKQSLAEAIVEPGQRTHLHLHRQSEEIYYLTTGHGNMTLGEEHFPVQSGDIICIPPGTPHCVENTGQQDLHILCQCSPAYRHDDTVIITGENQMQD